MKYNVPVQTVKTRVEDIPSGSVIEHPFLHDRFLILTDEFCSHKGEITYKDGGGYINKDIKIADRLCVDMQGRVYLFPIDDKVIVVESA